MSLDMSVAAYDKSSVQYFRCLIQKKEVGLKMQADWSKSNTDVLMASGFVQHVIVTVLYGEEGYVKDLADIVVLVLERNLYSSQEQPLHQYCLKSGLVDTIGLRIGSCADAETAEKLVNILFALLNTKECLTSEVLGILKVMNTVLKEEGEGPLADKNLKRSCLEALRRLCTSSLFSFTSFHLFVDSGLVATLMKYLHARDTHRDFQDNILEIFINVTSGSKGEVAALVDAGLLSILLNILETEEFEENLFGTVLWIIGNVLGDEAKSRDLCVHNGIIGHILKLTSMPELSEDLEGQIIWILGNVFRGGAKGVPLDLTKDIVKCVKPYLDKRGDPKVISDAVQAFKYMTAPYEGSTYEVVDYLQTLDILESITDLLYHRNKTVMANALEAVLNIVQSGKEHVIKGIIRDEVLASFNTFLGNRKRSNIKTAIQLLVTLVKAGYCEVVMRCCHVTRIIAYINVKPPVSQAVEFCQLVANQGSKASVQKLLQTKLIETCVTALGNNSGSDMKCVADTLKCALDAAMRWDLSLETHFTREHRSTVLGVYNTTESEDLKAALKDIVDKYCSPQVPGEPMAVHMK